MRTRTDAGTALIEFVWLAVLLIVPLVYVLVAVFEVQRTAYGASAASRSAARAFLQADDVASAHDRAQRAARVALDDQGVGAATVDVTCRPSPAACLEPGSSVVVTVHTTRPLPLTPTALGEQLAPITVDARHAEPYGSYRAGAR